MPKLTKKKNSKLLKAICVLHENKYNVSGVVKFTQLPKTLKIEYDINGLSNGLHGFHVHKWVLHIDSFEKLRFAGSHTEVDHL